MAVDPMDPARTLLALDITRLRNTPLLPAVLKNTLVRLLGLGEVGLRQQDTVETQRLADLAIVKAAGTTDPTMAAIARLLDAP